VDVRENYQPGISKSLADLKNLVDSRNTGLGKILQRVQKTQLKRVCQYALKQHEPWFH
jgi:hypothetical protein